MKSLPLHSQHYNYLQRSYQEYLQVLGYAPGTVQSWSVHVREFLHYLESQGIQSVLKVNTSHINDFVLYIKRRKNKRLKTAALSSSSINKIINAVNVFIKFLNSTGKYVVENTGQRAEDNIGERIILTIEEIKQLYEATFLPYRENSIAMGQRDRAIIAVFYSCGLRRTEGKSLNITDIDFQRRLLFVSKGKGGKQRYVPIVLKSLQDLKDSVEEGRDWFLYNHKNRTGAVKRDKTDHEALFLSQGGNRIDEFYQRLEQMKQRAEINKNLTLHGLRHSIATHLLQSGMDIEEIAKFLGHSSLASTQIYTHIINHHDEGL
jgi:integrase/recombinase XerD